MTQNEQIKEHLKSGKRITAIEALNLFHCFRLSARIKDLKEEGLKIDKTTIQRGEKHFAEYYLPELVAN